MCILPKRTATTATHLSRFAKGFAFCYLVFIITHTSVSLKRTISKQPEIPQSAEHTPSTYRASNEHLPSVVRP